MTADDAAALEIRGSLILGGAGDDVTEMHTQAREAFCGMPEDGEYRLIRSEVAARFVGVQVVLSAGTRAGRALRAALSSLTQPLSLLPEGARVCVAVRRGKLAQSARMTIKDGRLETEARE